MQYQDWEQGASDSPSFGRRYSGENQARLSDPRSPQGLHSALAQSDTSAETVKISMQDSSILQTKKNYKRKQDGSAAGFVSCFIALAIGCAALKTSNVNGIGIYGLIQAFSPLYYVALFILIISFIFSLHTRKLRTPLLATHLIFFVFLLDGAPSIIEQTARFQTAWLHVGFVGYIANTGNLLQNADARFNWPSFFEGAAMLDKVAGVNSAAVFLRWWPVAINLTYLPFIYSIGKKFLASELRAWVATALFPLANWVGQDYFSPQSIAYLFYLAFFYILVVPLGACDKPLWIRVLHRSGDKNNHRMKAQPSTASQSIKPSASGFYLVLLVLLMAAMATGHQLTPIMAVATALVLVAVGRTQVRGLTLLFPLIAIGWVCYGAVTFWSGHIGMVVGGLGNVGGNVGSTVVKRVSGSQAHEYVVDGRLVAAALVWGFALLGALVWRPRNQNRLVLPVIFLSSFIMVAGGNYGGEGMLRVYLFSLPGAVFLIAALLTKPPKFSHGQVALGAALLLLTPIFLVARWGNELYEMMLPGELATMNTLYRIATPGSNLVSINPFITWEYKDITKFKYLSVSLSSLTPKSEVLCQIDNKVAGNPLGGYVILTANQEAYGWQVLGLPQNWGITIENMLINSPNFKLRYSNVDGEVFQYAPKPHRQEKNCED